MIDLETRLGAQERIDMINHIGGPCEYVWPELNRLFTNLWELTDRPDDQDWVQELFSFVTRSPYDSCFKRILTQPEGYPGDYLTLYKLHHKSNKEPLCGPKDVRLSTEEKVLAQWDEYLFGQHSAGILAHRSVEVAGLVLKEVSRIGNHGTLAVKDIACGWGLVPEALWANFVPAHRIEYIGVDASQPALDFTKKLIGKCHVGFMNERFIQSRIGGAAGTMPESDITWSSGLFDYFDDHLFIRAAVNLLHSTRKTLVIGNMSSNCSSIAVGEVMGWYICTRTSDRLRNLGKLALAKYYQDKATHRSAEQVAQQIKVTQDPTGAQFYLYLTP